MSFATYFTALFCYRVKPKVDIKGRILWKLVYIRL
jgi:hypothetical protein